MPGKITYGSRYGRTQPQTEASRRWGNIKDTVRYSPYNANKRLNIPLPGNLSKSDWLKHHGYQNTMEFEDHAPQDEYDTLQMEWASYISAPNHYGGYGPGLPTLGGGGVEEYIAEHVAHTYMRGGKKSKGRKSKGRKSKSKGRVKSKGRKSVKSKGGKSKGSKSKGRKSKSKGRRRVKSKRK